MIHRFEQTSEELELKSHRCRLSPSHGRMNQRRAFPELSEHRLPPPRAVAARTNSVAGNWSSAITASSGVLVEELRM
jgi:hypothetical protein